MVRIKNTRNREYALQHLSGTKKNTGIEESVKI